MKVSCNREDLLSAVQMVAGVVPSRSPKPILLNIKLVATNDDKGTAATLMATDLELGIRCKVPNIEVQAGGIALLPTTRLLSILRESSDPVIEIESDDTHNHVRGQRSRYKLTSERPEDFPDVLDFTDEKYHTIPSTLLRTMIRRTVFATDVESTRYALNGLLVELDGNRIKLVGTDGRRLAVMGGIATAVGGHEAPATKDLSPVVPNKAMSLLDRTLDGDESEVHIALSPNKMLVQTPNVVISSRLVEGRFPRYQEVFPTRSEVTVSLNVKDLLQATRQAAIVTSEESRGVDYTFAEGKLTLVAQAAEVGQSQVELPIAYDAKAVTITFDPRYLVDMLRVLDDGTALTLDLIDHQSAAVFRADDGYSYIIMPLTRER